MAEYENREQNYANTLGNLIGTFTTDIVKADSMSKDAAAQRTIDAFAQGNFDLVSEVSLIGLNTPLRTHISAPIAIMTPMQPIVISEAVMETSMSVSASQSSEKSVDASVDVEGKAKIGFGPVSGSLSVKAHTAVHSSQKRSSDYRASCDTKITMVQGEVPEGVNRILDAMLLTVDKGMEINEKLISVQAQRLLEEADDTQTDDTQTDDSSDDFSDDTSADDTTDDSSDDSEETFS